MKPMKKSISLVLFILSFWVLAIPVSAQDFITGVVIDSRTQDSIPLVSVSYKSLHKAVVGSAGGEFSIARHEGEILTVSAVGYQKRNIRVNKNTPNRLIVRLSQDQHQLSEVIVNSKRKTKYSRKDNPAVELMRRVIAAKKKNDIANHDFYQYNEYQKITLSVNDIKQKDIDSGFFAKRKWLADQIEVSPYNEKLILPLSVDETVTQHLYRRTPHAEKKVIKGQRSDGINQLIQTGDILNTVMKDVFTNVDIYDDHVRLLQYPFPSPIGSTAISFYRYYIEDTVYVDSSLCYHLQFIPNNQQDFGFRGEIYILADSTLHVKQVNLSIPKRSDVNFVDHLQVNQKYVQLPNGEWVLSVDDMIVELTFAKFISKFVVARTTRNNDYDFSALPDRLFRGKTRQEKEGGAMMQDEAFWNEYRAVELTKGESGMDAFIHRIEQLKGFKYIIFGAKALIENFVETGPTKEKNMVDIGPVNTMFTSNFVDGFRTRLSAQTTANLNKHWFALGYYAHGWRSDKNYYRGDLIYSFNKKDFLPRDFPKRTITFSSSYDVASPSDKFIPTDKDNVFTALKWAKVDKMMFYNRQLLSFEYEQNWGFKTTVQLKTEENEPCGALAFTPLSEVGVQTSPMKIRTTEARVELRLEPGRTYVNTKQRRLAVNLDMPVFTLSHTMGFEGILGGDYRYNVTEVGIYKRFWMGSWGKIDTNVKAGAQWNQVPYPLLIMPAANLSYLIEDETFNLINNMEFLNDRYASLDVSWDMNGKIFNRLPLIKHLKWREYIGIKCLWGSLTDKNNPYLAQNAGSSLLMQFPEGSYVMDHRPYMEAIIGVHNIFKLFHVEYVHRLSYQELPTAHKNGVRFTFRMTF